VKLSTSGKTKGGKGGRRDLLDATMRNFAAMTILIEATFMIPVE
jgi:hypothetical protein